MANYFQIEKSSIMRLRREWNRFIEECCNEIDRKYQEASQDYYREASNDKREGRYSEESIDEWYKDKMKDLDTWAESAKDELRNTDNKGQRIINEIEFKKFYDDETSCVYMLDFNDGVIERKYNNKGYGIGTVGMYLTIDDVTINFEPTRLETTGWKPCKSR